MAIRTTKPRNLMFRGLLIGFILGLMVSAGTVLVLTQSPLPFVDKVEHLSHPVDASALDGIDPNSQLNNVVAESPEALSSSVTVPAPDNQQSTLHKSGTYSIQTGAFRSEKDAKRVQADLAFIALEADIVKSSDAGITLYRVILGPLETQKEAEQLQQRLNANGFAAMITKH